MDNGELVKVKIFAYKDKKLTQPVSDPDKREFEFPVNPESYSRNFKVEFDAKQAQGDTANDPKFTSQAPQELKLEFLFDGTQTIDGYTASLKELEVKDQIKRFLDVAYHYEGEIHQPNFLKVMWGKHLKFDCVLSNLDINYVLFKRSGDPLRAKISATFLNYKEAERRAKEADAMSPDLTHVRKVKDEETLPLMSYNIYNDANFYLQVAKANRLTSFRNLQVGQELLFPPLNDNTNQ